MTPQVERIKDELRNCQYVEEVNHVARKHGATVSDMMESPTLRVMAIQIKNLAVYKRLTLKPVEDATGQASLF